VLYHQYFERIDCPVEEVMFRNLLHGVHIDSDDGVFFLESDGFFVEMLDGSFCEMVGAGGQFVAYTTEFGDVFVFL